MRAADSIVSGATSQAATRHAMRRCASRYSAASVRPTTRMAIDSSGTTTLEINSTEVPMVRCLVMISQPFLLAHCRISLLLSCTAIALVSKNAWSGNPTGTGNGHAGSMSYICERICFFTHVVIAAMSFMPAIVPITCFRTSSSRTESS